MSSMKGQRIDWDTHPLGQVPDRVLAHQIGCTRAAVALARKQRGIPPFTVTHPATAKEFPSWDQGIKASNEIDWTAQPLLGQIPDTVLALHLGCRASTVYNARVRLGIPSTRGNTPKKQYEGTPRRFIAWEAQPLGKVPDRVLAEQLGIGCTTVREARQKRGIPRFHYGANK